MNYSVLMSVYIKERPEHLYQSMKSIFDQTVPTNDFVLVCDGLLTSELDEVIAFFQSKYEDILHVVRLDKNVGLGKALNIGMDVCRNEIIARMDSDDISLPDRCEKQLLVLKNNPNIDIVSTALYEVGDDRKILSIKMLPEFHEDILMFSKRRCPFNHPTVMYRKSVVLKAGGYQHFDMFEDYFLWIRLLRVCKESYNIQEPLLYMRAGRSMYARRGGISYLVKMLKFRTYMLKNKYCSLLDYLAGVGMQTLICLLPVNLRKIIYKKFLR